MTVESVRKVKSGYIFPSAAFTIGRRHVATRRPLERPPRAGDVVYGTVVHKGQHASLENKEGRIHTIDDGSKALFVYGSRYAPDAFEGVVPESFEREADLLARSGIVGKLLCKNTNALDCTRVKVYGVVCDRQGEPVNTLDYPLLQRIDTPLPEKSRAKLILCVGSAMNSGKSLAAAMCCWALSNMGHRVNASKVTGTASLKDILLMEDSGAEHVADFTHFGHPSTYQLEEADLLGIFRGLDAKFGGAPKSYWVVEFADGILQPETAMLLRSPEVQQRVHKLIYCARNAVDAIGGLNLMEERFGRKPDALSGFFASSPLALREVRGYTDVPFFDNVKRDLEAMARALV